MELKIKKMREIGKKKGFSLTELLIVMSIITLLATAIYASLQESSNRSKRAAVVETMKSLMLYLIECNMKGALVPAPDTYNGTLPCVSSPEYPKLGVVKSSLEGCSYSGSTSNVIRIVCSKGSVVILCDVARGYCN